METDNVADTLNYAQLLKIVKREMAVPSNLLEHVAGRIGKTVFHEFPQAEAIDLTVTKLNPPMGADCAGASVHVHLINDKTLQWLSVFSRKSRNFADEFVVYDEENICSVLFDV